MLDHRRRFSGFLLKDMLVLLFIALLMLPLASKSLEILASFKRQDSSIGDLLSLEKLKRELIIADELDLGLHELSFKKGEDIWRLIYQDKRLYLTPGYQLFLDDVDDLSFSVENGRIYVEYYKDQKYEKHLLR